MLLDISPRRHAALAAWVSLAVSGAALAAVFVLDRGYWIVTAGRRGPFTQETGGSLAYVTTVETSGVARVFFDVRVDDERPSQSPLRIFVNRQEAGPAGQPRREIRRRGDGRFGFYGSSLVFSLPRGIPNDASTTLHFEHLLRLKTGWRALAWSIASLSAGVLFVLRWRAGADRDTLAMILIGGAGTLARVVLTGAGVISACYLVAIAHGFMRHYALPPAAVLSLNTGLRRLAEDEPALPYIVLAFASLGTILSWCATLRPQLLGAQRDEEQRIEKLWQCVAPVLILAAYLFCAAGQWSGLSRQGDFSGVAIAGLVPFSDAAGHFTGPIRLLMEGRFDSWVERRLVAAATRVALALVVSYSATGFLLLQVALAAVATAAAVWSVTKWRGVWAGVTYFGLVYVLVRPFLTAFLTEALGITWALAALPFVVQALRTSAIVPAGIGLAFTFTALLTRMGSMLTVPAFALWMIWEARQTRRRLISACMAVICAFVLCLGLVWALGRLYGSGSGMAGSNMAYSLCGVAHGGTWGDCQRLYGSELEGAPEADRARILYRKAWEMATRHPGRAINRVAEGEVYYLRNVLHRAVLGYFGLPAPRVFPTVLWELIAVLGVAATLLRPNERGERQFWLMMALAPILTVPLFIFDDGWRALSSIGPLVALLLASGFATPARRSQVLAGPRVLSAWSAVSLGVVLVAVLISAPWIAHQLDPIGSRSASAGSLGPDEVWVFGGRVMAGVLVVPDRDELPSAVPAVHYSDFERLIRDSMIEYYGTILRPQLRWQEFGFVAGGGSVFGPLLITPPEVVRDQAVPGWKLRVIDRGEQRYYFWVCDSATALPRTVR